MLNNPALQTLGYIHIQYRQRGSARPMFPLSNSVGIQNRLHGAHTKTTRFLSCDDGKRYPPGHPLALNHLALPAKEHIRGHDGTMHTTYTSPEYKVHGTTRTIRDQLLKVARAELQELLPSVIRTSVAIDPVAVVIAEVDAVDYVITLPAREFDKLTDTDRYVYSLRNRVLARWVAKEGYIETLTTIKKGEKRLLLRPADAHLRHPLPAESNFPPSVADNTKPVDTSNEAVERCLKKVHMTLAQEDQGGAMELDYVLRRITLLPRRCLNSGPDLIPGNRVVLVPWHSGENYFFNHKTAARHYLPGAPMSRSFVMEIEVLLGPCFEEAATRLRGDNRGPKLHRGYRGPRITERNKKFQTLREETSRHRRTASKRVLAAYVPEGNYVQVFYSDAGTTFCSDKHELKKLHPGGDGKRYMRGHTLRIPWLSIGCHQGDPAVEIDCHADIYRLYRGLLGSGMRI